MGSVARFGRPFMLAVSLNLLVIPIAFSAPEQVNSINEGSFIQGGVYYNTPGSRTTFQNNNGELHLPSGQVVRGLESNINAVVNGNGGTMYFRAPGNMIRFDGDVDVSAIRNGAVYLGNGGKVFVDSAYLYQTGNIYANGVNGGLVHVNVGAMTMGPGAKIMAQGFGGNGGTVSINAPGTVEMQRGSIIDTSGKVIGTYDTNVISIAGGVVNNAGILNANGIAMDSRPDSAADARMLQANPNLANNPKPGPISPGDGTGQIFFGPPLDFVTPDVPSTRGGTIRLVATGQPMGSSDVIQASGLNRAQKSALLARHAFLESNGGDLANTGLLQARGFNGEDGGSILLTAADDLLNFGSMMANGSAGNRGGNGGAILMSALDAIQNFSIIESSGGAGRTSGQGGLLAFSYNTMSNTGMIRANGGRGFQGGLGGLIVFSGNGNPTGPGGIQAYGFGNGGGTVVLPSLGSIPSGALQRVPRSVTSHLFQEGQRNQLLIHGENAVLLSQSSGTGTNSDSFSARLADATIRSVENPNDLSMDPVEAVKDKANMLIFSSSPDALNLDFVNANTNPIFIGLNSLMVQNNGSVTNSMHWSPGVQLVGPGSHDTAFSVGGGHISINTPGSITNNGFLLTRGFWSGGNIHLTAGQDMVNNHVISNIAFNKDLASGFAPKPGYVSSHSGITILKANNDIINNYRINSPMAFYDIHPILDPLSLIWPTFLNGAQIGATNYVLAGNTIQNNTGAHLSSDVLTYRGGPLGLENPSLSSGGLITLKAGNGITNNGSISVNGRAYDGLADGSEADSIKFPAGTTFDDLHATDSQDGVIFE